MDGIVKPGSHGARLGESLGSANLLAEHWFANLVDPTVRQVYSKFYLAEPAHARPSRLAIFSFVTAVV